MKHPLLLGSLTFILVIVVGYFETILDLIDLWAGVEVTIYRYGFLVLACSIYLLYLKRDLLGKIKPRPVSWGLLFTTAFSFAWLVSNLTDVRSIQLAILPLLVLSVVLAAFGKDIFRHTSIPILLLLFAMPLWSPLYPYLKDMTTLVTEAVLRIIDKPVFVEGYYLHLPGGSFFVDNGCAGLRFLLVTLILCFFAIDLYSVSLRASIILLIIGVALALVANWIRVITVVLVGDATNMAHRWVSDHNDLGWAIYGLCVLAPLLFLARQYIPGQSIAEDPEAKFSNTGNQSSRLPMIMAVSIVSLLIGPGLLLVLNKLPYRAFEPELPSIVDEISENRLSRGNNETWQPAYLNDSVRLLGQYSSGGSTVNLHIVNYSEQNEESELINVNNLIADGEDWTEVPGSTDRRRVSVSAGSDVEVKTTELTGPRSSRLVVWFWYEIGAFSATSPVNAKIFQLISLASRRRDANLVALAVECDGLCGDREDQVLNDFLADHFFAIKSGLSLPAAESS